MVCEALIGGAVGSWTAGCRRRQRGRWIGARAAAAAATMPLCRRRADTGAARGAWFGRRKRRSASLGPDEASENRDAGRGADDADGDQPDKGEKCQRARRQLGLAGGEAIGRRSAARHRTCPPVPTGEATCASATGGSIGRAPDAGNSCGSARSGRGLSPGQSKREVIRIYSCPFIASLSPFSVEQPRKM